jgi:NAD(P)-dependent dehydrogenase (short-subunit alcohol dehydrogenase family)
VSGPLAGRNVLVTGAGGGLGRAIAVAAAAAGARLLLLGRTVHRLEAVHDAIVAAGGTAPILVPADLRTLDAALAQQIADAIGEQCGALHGLVHNAAVAGPRVPVRFHGDADWDAALAVNVSAPFRLTRALLPVLEAARGAVLLFVSADVARRPRAYWGAYAVSKAALEALATLLADELASTSDIRVNVVDPGALQSALRARLFPGDDVTALPPAEAPGAAIAALLAEPAAHGSRSVLALPAAAGR